ncbi:accessory Sec system glycosylation chaperone GtfB [Streptococcus tangpeifui]|uniref:accessory Sec system glycosylation chaperone GtfB n=1 Tax=Streptococcus tangpeifui TaxID=2709400 RepID=UPI0013EB4E9D
MINLFENYNQDSWDLHYSLILSGYQNTTIAINDNGFLPDDVTSPFLFFTGFVNATGKPLHFNEIPVPKFWEIKATNSSGEIFDLNKKRANIHFSKPSHNRFVQSVDWLDEAGKVRSTDHYNKYGYRFAQTIYNRESQAVQKSYYDKSGKEVLVENYVTSDLILEHEGKIYIFKSKADFVTYYIQASGYDLDRIIFNSLGMPFLVKYQLHQKGEDVLFWQEPIGDSLPYNMQLLLDPAAERKTKIIVQDFKTYEQILRMVTPEQREAFTYVGLLYPFQRDNQARKEALILTNSDQLDYVENIIEDFPDMTLHIAALTEMSSKLLSLGRFSNVHLYPNVTNLTVRQLFGRCDIYLDINQGNEILSAIRTAFESRQLILGFKERMHNPRYSAPEFFFGLGNYASFRDKLRNVLGNRAAITLDLQSQYKAANLAMPEDYRRELGQPKPALPEVEDSPLTAQSDRTVPADNMEAEANAAETVYEEVAEATRDLETTDVPVDDSAGDTPADEPLQEAGAALTDPAQVFEAASNQDYQPAQIQAEALLDAEGPSFTVDLTVPVSTDDTEANDVSADALKAPDLLQTEQAEAHTKPSVHLEPNVLAEENQD